MKSDNNTSRRAFIKKGAAAALSVSVLSSFDLKAFSNTTPMLPELNSIEGEFELPPLPYDYNALEPHIDTMTMMIHHDKHHATYVQKLNEAVAQVPGLKGRPLEELITNVSSLPETVRNAVRNHGGGHWNHSFFWNLMAPNATTKNASDKLSQAVKTGWKDMDSFKAEFNKAATGVFGSGWAWLVKDRQSGALSIVTTPNQDNPLMDISGQRGKPILGIDVWEHAYYLKYQNKRADYVAAFWNVVNWEQVSKWYEEA
jgi:Fe-Mn family superoxide dismutase